MNLDTSKAFDSIRRGKMEQIIRVYDLPKNRVMAILMLYKNTKAMVCSSDGDIDFLDIVAGVLQGVTLASYMFIICQDYILWTSIDLIKENGFTIKKEKSDDIQQKLWLMIKHFSRIYLPKSSPYCKAWS